MDDTQTDADDFGLGYGDPRDGGGIDQSALQATPGFSPEPSSQLPDGSDPETHRRNGPDSGEARRVKHPHKERRTPTPQNTTQSTSQLPGDGQYSEHSEYSSLGDSGMMTVEDISSPKKDQPSDAWPDWDTHLSSRIRCLAVSLRSTNA